MFELKLSQGAKPGKGGILPGRKVSRMREPRQLRRFHARIVTENRHSVSLEELYAAQSAQNDNTRPS